MKMEIYLPSLEVDRVVKCHEKIWNRKGNKIQKHCKSGTPEAKSGVVPRSKLTLSEYDCGDDK